MHNAWSVIGSEDVGRRGGGMRRSVHFCGVPTVLSCLMLLYRTPLESRTFAPPVQVPPDKHTCPGGLLSGGHLSRVGECPDIAPLMPSRTLHCSILFSLVFPHQPFTLQRTFDAATETLESAVDTQLATHLATALNTQFKKCTSSRLVGSLVVVSVLVIHPTPQF